MQRLTFHQKLLLCLFSILILCTTFFSFATYYVAAKNDKQNSEILGNILSQQAANAAKNLILTKDRLALHILINDLTKSPAIIQASILNEDRQPLATSSKKENAVSLQAKAPTYQSDIIYQGKIIGYTQIAVNDTTGHQLFIKHTSNVLLYSIPLLLTCYILTLRFCRNHNNILVNSTIKLTQLCRINNVPIKPIANEFMFIEEHIGSLYKQNKLQLKSNQNSNAFSVLIAFRVNNIHPLKRQMSSTMLQKKLDSQLIRLEEAAALYDGDICYAAEGSGYIKFHIQNEYKNALNAACCVRLISLLLSKQIDLNALDIRLGLSCDASISPGSPAILSDAATSKALIHACTQHQGIVIEPKVHNVLRGNEVMINIDHSGNYIMTQLAPQHEKKVLQQSLTILSNQTSTSKTIS